MRWRANGKHVGSQTMTTSPEPSVAERSELPPEEPRAEAGVYATTADGFDHGLVALAMGSPFWLVECEAGHRLLVPPMAAERVREQLAIYDRENFGWPPPRGREPAAQAGRFASALFVSSLWALSVLAVFAAQGEWPGLVSAGALDARGLFGDSEWWRPATALFLHADLGHVSSNVAGGVFLFSTVLAAFGRGRGAGLLALAAMAGNVAAAAIHYPTDYRSIGASTAVFAALGLLTGRAVRVVGQDYGSRRWRAMLTPLAAGLTMLALFGAGEQRVDVLAHATGFAAGLLAGGLCFRR